MKRIFNFIFLIAVSSLLVSVSSCKKDGPAETEGNGISNINNPWEGDTVSSSGETVTITFDAAAAWNADLELSDGGDWAEIAAMNNNSAAGRGSVRIYVDQNSSDERTISLYVTVDGYPRTLLCELVQAAGDAVLNESLNSAMHAYLKENYLWKDEYNQLDAEGKIDLSAPYTDFLYTNLTKMGDTNIEDGGIYREYSVYEGERYIYSYLNESTSGAAAFSKAPATRAMQAGLGIGPTNSIRWEATSDAVVLVVGYVYQGSPAAKAGLKKGDMINSVNGTTITMSNYARYQQELYYTTSGSYTLRFVRQQPELDNNGQPVYDENGNYRIMTTNSSVDITAGSYQYNPVLTNSVILLAPKTGGEPHRIGYMALESFDLSAQSSLEWSLNQLLQNNIEDLILDLRFCVGGAMEQCRYLMTSIVGSANLHKTMARLEFADNEWETWTFERSDNPDVHNTLGNGPDLGINRLYVICSESTASAAEIVINTLKGIDFPVYTFGSRTEGKNVGMTTSVIYNNSQTRSFEFAPITFRIYNAKENSSDYADGIEPVFVVNNQNTIQTSSDDIDYMFPYGPNDWEWWFREYAVSWAVSWIVDGENPDWVNQWYEDNNKGTPPVITSSSVRYPGPQLSSSAFAGADTRSGSQAVGTDVIPLRRTSVSPVFGRTGTLIYTDNVIVLPDDDAAPADAEK